MGLTKMKYTPEEGLRSTSYFPDTPVSPDAAREQFQRLFDQVKVQVNALMEALESTEPFKSGAENIGSAAIGQLTYNNAPANTIWAQLAALNAKLIEAMNDGITVSEVIKPHTIVADMLAENAVTADSIADNAVGEANIQDGAVTTGKLGTVNALMLKPRPEVGMDEFDTLRYENGKLAFKLADCQLTQLVPAVFGTGATAPAGTFPAGTIYVQYVP